MVSYDFYQSSYEGVEIPDESEFRAAAREAQAKLQYYEKMYRVEALGENLEQDRAMAICAMAETLHRFRRLEGKGGVASTTIGSVSTSYKLPDVDTSPQCLAKELYRQAGTYLSIYRGCSLCAR